MRLGNRQFTPSVIPTLLTVLVLLALIRLGFWQLHRADYKRGLIRDFAATREQAPVPLAQISGGRASKNLPRFARVKLQGHFDSQHQILLSEMQHAGQVGFYVLTPFKRAANSRIILINRGWVPANSAQRPHADLEVSQHKRDVRGILGKLPVPGIRLGSGGANTTPWPKIMLYPTLDTLEQTYHKALFPRLVLLDPGAPNGFVRDWKPVIGLPPERHIAYAIQWFALALTLCVIWLVANLHRRPAAMKTNYD